MDFNSIEDIIKFAIEKEDQAIAFYNEISELESFTSSKDIFKDFVNEETKHKSMLDNFLNDKSLIDQYNLKWIQDIKRSDYIVEFEYEKGMPYVDILRLAMKREEKSLQLYNHLQSKAKDDKQLKIFQILAQEEAKHKSILEKIYDDHLAKQGD